MKKSIRRKASVLVLAAVMTVVFSAPAFAAAKKTSGSGAKSNIFISAKQAKSMVGKKNVLFVDTRPESAVKKQGTVKGSIGVAWQNLSTMKNAGEAGHCAMLPAKQMSKVLTKFGMTKKKNIVIIGQTVGGWGDDGRVLWELRACGFTKARIVNGGWQALKAAKVKTAKTFAKAKAAKVTVTSISQKHNVTTKQLHDKYSEYKVVDVRSKEEWDGATKYGETKGGHLKDAVFIPYDGLFRKNGTLKSDADIVKMFSSKGIKKGDCIVTYCTGGIRSAYMELVLEKLGYKCAANYAESFWRWNVAYPDMVE